MIELLFLLYSRQLLRKGQEKDLKVFGYEIELYSGIISDCKISSC